MKIRFGEIAKDAKRFTNEINRTDWGDMREQLSVDIEDTAASVAGLDEVIIQNFSGELVLDGEDAQEVFSDFKYEGIRKNYDSKGKQVTVMFRKSQAGQETPVN